jgi:hypothetical protein
MKFSYLITLILFFVYSGQGELLAIKYKQNSDTISSDYKASHLFENEDIIQLCLEGDIRKLFLDREENSSYHSIILSYSLHNSDTTTLNIKVKTRGHFRRDRENCIKPPLLLTFSSDSATMHSLFAGQNKVKLVTACKHEKLVLREYLIYKIYDLIAENTFRARLVQVNFHDTKKGKKTESLFGILLEDQMLMAKRNNAHLIKKRHLNPKNTNRETFLKMAVFQFLIGNTDWSVQFLHNIKLLNNTSVAGYIPVPYDFDHAGIVESSYANPAQELKLPSVRQRRYRGYCIENMQEFDSLFACFAKNRLAIYKLYTDNPLLEKAYVKRTIKYLDQFYEIINDEEASKKAFQYPCNPKGTGNVVIKGLKD